VRRCRTDQPDHLDDYLMVVAVKWLTDITEHPTSEGTLYLCNQGLRLEPDRGLLDRIADDLRAPGGRTAQRDRRALTIPFFALLQKNVLDRQRWTTREQLRLAIVTWSEKYLPPPTPATPPRPTHRHRV
jgi:putative transposase